MTFDAKANFIAKKDLVRKHRELMASPDFQSAAEAALQHFCDIETRQGNKAKRRYHRIAGARDFLGTLLNLGEQITAPARPERQELNYRT